jgi:hypothetical protein
MADLHTLLFGPWSWTSSMIFAAIAVFWLHSGRDEQR